MTERLPPPLLPRNRQTQAAHHRETFWQIYLPAGIALALLLGVSALAWAASRGGGAVARAWADVSLVFLVVQAMIFALPLLLLFVGAVMGAEFVMRKSPPYFKIAQDRMAQTAGQVRRAMKYVVQPVMAAKSAVAGFEGFVQGARRFFRFNSK